MSATDPYAARGPKPTTSTEVEPDLDYFVRRLEQLGATGDEIELVRDSWDAFDAEWTPEGRAALVRAGDAEVVAMIEATRAEYVENTTTEDEAAAQAEVERLAAIDRDAAPAVAGTVDEAMAWVGTDVDRARAVLVAEQQGGGGRVTLVRQLEQLIGSE